jgi:quercetin dioxygenase-like cupin family protein
MLSGGETPYACKQEMEQTTMMRISAAGAVFFALCGTSGWVLGQEVSNPAFTGNKIIPLIKAGVTGVATKQVIANVYEVPAGAMVPRHFHHGDEFHYVLSGEWAAEVEGMPTKTLKSGEAQYVENGRWHGGKATGDTPLRLLGLMIVDKDQPITTIVK